MKILLQTVTVNAENRKWTQKRLKSLRVSGAMQAKPFSITHPSAFAFFKNFLQSLGAQIPPAVKSVQWLLVEALWLISTKYLPLHSIGKMGDIYPGEDDEGEHKHITSGFVGAASIACFKGLPKLAWIVLEKHTCDSAFFPLLFDFRLARVLTGEGSGTPDLAHLLFITVVLP